MASSLLLLLVSLLSPVVNKGIDSKDLDKSILVQADLNIYPVIKTESMSWAKFSVLAEMVMVKKLGGSVPSMEVMVCLIAWMTGAGMSILLTMVGSACWMKLRKA
jgi:hypothetical protein